MLIAFVSESCSNEKIENDWTKDNLKGKVLSYSEFSYQAESQFGNIKKGKRERSSSYLDYQKKFDEKGNVIKLNFYNSDGSLANKRSWEYDKNGNVIELNDYNSDGSAFEKETFKYEYDERGNWHTSIHSEGQTPKYILERVYEYYD